MKPFIRIILTAFILCIPMHLQAFSASGFSNPYGIVVDPTSNYIYVSNINGDQSAEDDNGFISRLKGDGTIDDLHFIDGKSTQITLHAPKGMAIVKGILYIADIDMLHAFDAKTGRYRFDVNFGDLPVQHFFDITEGPDGALYVADGPGNTIYRIDVTRQHEVTRFLSESSLGQPHGIAWLSRRQLFAVTGWSSGEVTAYDTEGKRQIMPAILLRTLEGIAADDAGNLYVASAGLNAVYRIDREFALGSFQLGIPSPGGVCFDRTSAEIIIASTNGNDVHSVPLHGKPATSVPSEDAAASMIMTPSSVQAESAAEGKPNGAQGESIKSTAAAEEQPSEKDSAGSKERAVPRAAPEDALKPPAQEKQEAEKEAP